MLHSTHGLTMVLGRALERAPSTEHSRNKNTHKRGGVRLPHNARQLVSLKELQVLACEHLSHEAEAQGRTMVLGSALERVLSTERGCRHRGSRMYSSTPQIKVPAHSLLVSMLTFAGCSQNGARHPYMWEILLVLQPANKSKGGLRIGPKLFLQAQRQQDVQQHPPNEGPCPRPACQYVIVCGLQPGTDD